VSAVVKSGGGPIGTLTADQRIALSAAVRDANLLGGVIKWWPRQLYLLDSLDGPEQMHLWPASRQVGKSSMGSAFAVQNCTMRPDLDRLLPAGRTRFVLVCNPGETQSREFIALCQALIDGSPLLRRLATVRSDRIDFRIPRLDADGTRWVAKASIAAMAANSRTARGRTASAVVLDEFGHFSDSAGPGSDEQMYAALVPSLRAFGAEGKLLITSTPNGPSGKFHQLYEAAEGGVLHSARVAQAALWDIMPEVDEAWLEARRAELGEALYQQEFGAQFVDAGGSFFDLSEVQFEDAPAAVSDAASWTAAFDPAFHRDKFGVALLGESASSPGEIVVGPVAAIDPKGTARSFEQRRAREDATLAAVWDLIEPYRPERIVTDQHNSAAMTSYFERRGVPVEVVNLTGPVQTASFVATRARLVDGSLRCWRHPQLVEDLRRVRARDTETIFLPRYGGSHCDAAAALALGVHLFAERPYAPAAATTVDQPSFSMGTASFWGSEYGA
jgi:hypothetical protein